MSTLVTPIGLNRKSRIGRLIDRAIHACPDPDVMRTLPLSWWQEHRRIVAPTLIAEPSLWHATCHHHLYDLTCADFELMLIEAGFTCTRCGTATEYLEIDHSHESWGAVRHILCPKCNTHLAFVDAGRKPLDDLTRAYLSRPFQRRHPFTERPVHSDKELARRKELCIAEATRRRAYKRAEETRARTRARKLAERAAEKASA